MKTTLSTCLIAFGLISTSALAGDALRGDTDGDGRLSRAEATARASERTGNWFDKLDADQDGYVTQDEMKKAREDRRAGMREKMEQHFNEADANQDGQLSLDEVQAKMPRLAERFGVIDKDQNGLLSKDEMSQAARHRHAPQG